MGRMVKPASEILADIERLDNRRRTATPAHINTIMNYRRALDEIREIAMETHRRKNGSLDPALKRILVVVDQAFNPEYLP